MPTESLQVTFVSSWEEGEIRTRARLNPSTGQVYDIEVTEHGDNYQHLLGEYIESLDGLKLASVIRQDAGEDYRFSSVEALAEFVNGQGESAA